MRLCLSLLCFVCLAACESRGSSTTPTAPSSMTSALDAGAALASRTVASHQDVRVNMHDACDPDSFNAVLGASACTRPGGMKFDDFIATLTRLGFVGPWQFAPNNANVRSGATFVAINQGGETHTFTEVDQFGGGIVPSLNELAHATAVAPECQALEADDFLAPGGTYREQVSETGTVKFQCCIHPWMKLEAQVAAR
jgi:plastocyanin